MIDPRKRNILEPTANARWLVSGSLLLLASSAGMAQQPHYTITDLGQPHAAFLNNHGQVALVSLTGLNPNAQLTMWQNGSTAPLGTVSGFNWVGPGDGPGSRLFNDQGLLGLVVCCDAGTNTRHAATFFNGATTILPNLPGATGAGLMAVNNAGVVSGASTGGNAVIWSNGGVVIVAPGTAQNGYHAAALNDLGQVLITRSAGYQQESLIFQNGALVPINMLLPNTQNCIGEDINNSGDVVGMCGNLGGGPAYQRAFLWRNGVMTDVGPDLAASINDAGIIVGGNRTTEGWVRINGIRYDLNSSTIDGWMWPGLVPLRVNNNGQILAWRLVNSQRRYYFLEPVPPGGTPAGTNVRTQPVDAVSGMTPVTLTFSSVIQAGTTTLSLSAAGISPPPTFKAGNPPKYYDLNTTATFSGSIKICITYQTGSFSNPSGGRLFHFENGAWLDVTTSNDLASRTICGAVSSLSPFALFETAYQGAIQSPINPEGSSVFPANRGVVPVKFKLSLNGLSTCQLPPATIALSRVSAGATGAISEYLQASDNGANFRIDQGACQYVYNVETSNLGAGTYEIQLRIGGATAGTAKFSLR